MAASRPLQLFDEPGPAHCRFAAAKVHLFCVTGNISAKISFSSHLQSYLDSQLPAQFTASTLPSTLKGRSYPADTGNTLHKRRIFPDFPFIIGGLYYIGGLHTFAGGDTLQKRRYQRKGDTNGKE